MNTTLIDFNSIAKACWENKYDTNEPPKFEEVNGLTSDNICDLLCYVDGIECFDSYLELRKNIIEALKTLLTLAHIKQINLNDFFKISLNLKE